jgi:hypothetical protein
LKTKIVELPFNRTTNTIVSWLGALIGLAGMSHGIFEALQGNNPTGGLIIQAIGPAKRFWEHGTEEAFTLVPNFLATGILAMLVGLAVIVWSAGFIHRKHSAAVFLLFCILLFLVGGGIGQIIFFTFIWLAATRIHSPLSWWKKVLPERSLAVISRIWPVTLAVGIGLFLVALEIAIFGAVPGVAGPEQRLYICWSALMISLVCFMVSFVSGFSRDILMRKVG